MRVAAPHHWNFPGRGSGGKPRVRRPARSCLKALSEGERSYFLFANKPYSPMKEVG